MKKLFHFLFPGESFLLLMLPVLLSACAVNPEGLGESIDIDVQPRIICAGEPVTIRWDFTGVPRSFDNCEFPDGGLSERLTCETTPECPGGVVCIDGGCCADGIDSDECGAAQNDKGGCLPNLALSIESDTFDLVPPQDGEPPNVEGSRVINPIENAQITIEAGYEPPPTEIVPTPDYRIVVVSPSPGSNLTLNIPFQCVGETGVYPSVYIGESTENVVVVGLVNVSGNTMQVFSDLDHTQVTLRTGERTEAFNGKVASRWIASLSPSDPAGTLPTRCLPTGIENPKPDLAIRLELVCQVDE